MKTGTPKEQSQIRETIILSSTYSGPDPLKPSSYQRQQQISLLLVIVFMTASSIWIGIQINAFKAYQMDLDEAVHANRGLDIASAVLRGSPSDLWTETVKPEWYPPAYGYLLGVWLMLFGYSLPAARMFALICYFLLGIVLWLSARKAFPEANPFLYLLPPLFLVSDDQHVIHASLVMLELPAILLAIAALLSLNHSIEKPSTLIFFITSVFSMLCFMTRYSHGIILLVSLGICYAVLLLTRFKGRFWQIGLAWAPALAFTIIWLAVLGHWKWLLAYSEVQGGSTVVSTLKGYLFYPRQLLLKSFRLAAAAFIFILDNLMDPEAVYSSRKPALSGILCCRIPCPVAAFV